MQFVSVVTDDPSCRRPRTLGSNIHLACMQRGWFRPQAETDTDPRSPDEPFAYDLPTGVVMPLFNNCLPSPTVSDFSTFGSDQASRIDSEMYMQAIITEYAIKIELTCEFHFPNKSKQRVSRQNN